MNKYKIIIPLVFLLLCGVTSYAQKPDPELEKIIESAVANNKELNAYFLQTES